MPTSARSIPRCMAPSKWSAVEAIEPHGAPVAELKEDGPIEVVLGP